MRCRRSLNPFDAISRLRIFANWFSSALCIRLNTIFGPPITASLSILFASGPSTYNSGASCCWHEHRFPLLDGYFHIAVFRDFRDELFFDQVQVVPPQVKTPKLGLEHTTAWSTFVVDPTGIQDRLEGDLSFLHESLRPAAPTPPKSDWPIRDLCCWCAWDLYPTFLPTKPTLARARF